MQIPFLNADKNNSQLAYRTAAYMMYAFFTLHFVLPLYINSNFLSTLVSDASMSFVFAVAAAIAILTMATVSRALPRFGNYRSIFALLIAESFTVCILAIPTTPVWLLISAFISHWVLTAVIRFNLDIFLEEFSDDEHTGKIRGTVLMLNNIAFVVGPLVAGFVIGENAFWQIYLIAAVLMVLPLYILITNFRTFKDPVYPMTTLLASVKNIWKDKNIRLILGASFIMRLFFTWMVVYTPIYLRQYIGLPFDEIGIIFAIMLLPFVLLAEPLGNLADTYWGEKELLIGGFLVMAGFTAALSFVNSQAVLVWGALLFGGRIGATMVQTMSEIYFFKHVESRNTDVISVLRMIRPASYIVAPLLASAFLMFLSFSSLFIAIALTMLAGVAVSLPLVDTK